MGPTSELDDAALLPAAAAGDPSAFEALYDRVYLAAPRVSSVGSPWWAWPMQRGGPDASWLVAVALLTVGASTYAVRGPDSRSR